MPAIYCYGCCQNHCTKRLIRRRTIAVGELAIPGGRSPAPVLGLSWHAGATLAGQRTFVVA